jgi:heat shock protein HslJ
VLPLSATLLLSACTASGGGADTTDALLTERRWELVEWAPHAVPGEPRAALEFDGERASGFAGCNRFTGSYVLRQNRLTMDKLASTKRACPQPEMQFEDAFLRAIASLTLSHLQSTRLIALSAAGEKMVFLARPKPGKSARTRFSYVASQKGPCTSGAARTDCLQVRDSKDQPWRIYHGSIEGFRFEPGIEYRLRILEEDAPNPLAGGPSLRWTLDLLVEQSVVERQ